MKLADLVFFSVVVACSLQRIFALDCLNTAHENIMNCNDCIRCGGYWCNKPLGEDSPHCSRQQNDNWCGEGNLEELPSIDESTTPGELLSPRHYAVSVTIDNSSPMVTFSYSRNGTTEPEVRVNVLNTTQTKNIEIQNDPSCMKDKCTSELTIIPRTDFCLPKSGKHEYIHLKVEVENVTEEAMVKYHVPCACACSDKIEKNSPICNSHGDYSCGACNCHAGRSGKFCETVFCEGRRRGDLQCTNPFKDNVYCSGNGKCSECDTCICNEDGEGSQYFQPDNYCADLCLIIASECDSCLHDRPFGKCSECQNLTIRDYNETLLKEVDSLERRVWVRCEEHNYAAMRDERNDIYIMRIGSHGTGASTVAGKVDIVVPTVLGVLALVATVAVVAGYMVWKARNAPIPLSASQYQELEGPEGSAGINPLYKSPTSSYNNPMWKGAKV